MKGEPTRAIGYDIRKSWGKDTEVTFPETSMEGVGRNIKKKKKKKFETCPGLRICHQGTPHQVEL